MTQFEFFIIMIVARSFIPKFAKTQSAFKVYFSEWANTDNEIYGHLAVLFMAILHTVSYWLAAGYLVPYFNKYIPL